MTILRS